MIEALGNIGKPAVKALRPIIRLKGRPVLVTKAIQALGRIGADALLATHWARWTRRGIAAWAALAVVLLLGMSFASDQYRRGGRDPVEYVLESDHEMVRDLRLTECCSISVDPEKGAWPRKHSYFHVHYIRPFLIPPPPPELALPEVLWD